MNKRDLLKGAGAAVIAPVVPILPTDPSLATCGPGFINLNGDDHPGTVIGADLEGNVMYEVFYMTPNDDDEGWYQYQIGDPCEPIGPFKTKALAIASAERGEGAP